MRRREFIVDAGLTSAALARPMLACGQQPAMPVVGLLHGASQETFFANVAAFKQGPSQIGYIDGHNVTIELPVLAAVLVRRRVGARTLGVEIPPTPLARADEVIE